MRNISSYRLKRLISEIKTSELYNNILSLIVYGSQMYGDKNTINDADFCIVLHKRKPDNLHLIAKLFKKHYKNLDITIYYKDELRESLPFRDIGTGCFAMHYFAIGNPLIGKNIFIEKYKKLPKKLYQHSLKEKMFDYLLRLRRAYVVYNSKRKMLSYAEKYTSRLLIDLMVYSKPTLLPTLIKNSPGKVFLKAKQLKIITKVPNPHNIDVANDYLQILDEITNILLRKLK